MRTKTSIFHSLAPAACCLAAILVSTSLCAQEKGFRSLLRGRTSIERGNPQPKPPAKPVKKAIYMNYEIVDNDTVYLDYIQPTWIFAKSSGKTSRDWRRYYKLVYNFNKVYPYALIARKLVIQADSTITVNNFSRSEKDRYVKAMQKELMGAFETPLKHMSITQGVLLVKLVDREVGKSAYYIIKDYKSGIAAGFWQGIAKLFGNNLKNGYDPKGAEKPVEELIKKWDNGTFRDFYYSIFWEYPPVVKLPSKYK